MIRLRGDSHIAIIDGHTPCKQGCLIGNRIRAGNTEQTQLNVGELILDLAVRGQEPRQLWQMTAGSRA